MGRRKFTREFKISAVKLVQERGYSPAELRRLRRENAQLRIERDI